MCKDFGAGRHEYLVISRRLYNRSDVWAVLGRQSKGKRSSASTCKVSERTHTILLAWRALAGPWAPGGRLGLKGRAVAIGETGACWRQHPARCGILIFHLFPRGREQRRPPLTLISGGTSCFSLLLVRRASQRSSPARCLVIAVFIFLFYYIGERKSLAQEERVFCRGMFQSHLHQSLSRKKL